MARLSRGVTARALNDGTDGMQFSPKASCAACAATGRVGLYNQLLSHRRWLEYGGDRVVAGDKEQDQHGDEAL